MKITGDKRANNRPDQVMSCIGLLSMMPFDDQWFWEVGNSDDLEDEYMNDDVSAIRGAATWDDHLDALHDYFTEMDGQLGQEVRDPDFFHRAERCAQQRILSKEIEHLPEARPTKRPRL